MEVSLALLARSSTLATGAALAVVLAVGGGVARAAAPAEVGQWRFDEPSGQVASDDGPFGLEARLGSSDAPDGADPERIAGSAGGALRFDGASIVRLPASSALALQTLSVEAVVRAPESPGQWRYVVSRGGRGCVAGSYGLYTAAAGGIAFYVFDGRRYVVSAVAQPGDVWNGAWHHVAGTFDGRQLRLYVDGRAVGAAMDAPLRIDYDTTSSRASVGQYAGTCDLGYTGDVDLVRIAAGALSPEAVLVAAQGGSPFGGIPPAQPPAMPLAPAAPGRFLPEPAAPGEHGSSAPAARSCAVRLSRTHMPARRRTVVRARVVGRPGAARLTVVARRSRHGRTVAKARAGRAGVARLVVKVKRAGRLTVGVSGHAGCTPADLWVTRG